MPYFAAALARTDSGWTGEEVDLDEFDDLEGLADHLRDLIEDGPGPAVLLLEQDDEYVGIVRDYANCAKNAMWFGAKLICVGELRKNNPNVVKFCRFVWLRFNDVAPYFIGLLGERYGWIPDEIPQELIEQEDWLKEHLQHSVTELEILHGVLNDPQMNDHALFYFRDSAYLDSLSDKEKSEFLESPTEEEIKKYGKAEAENRAKEQKAETHFTQRTNHRALRKKQDAGAAGVIQTRKNWARWFGVICRKSSNGFIRKTKFPNHLTAMLWNTKPLPRAVPKFISDDKHILNGLTRTHRAKINRLSFWANRVRANPHFFQIGLCNIVKSTRKICW